MVYGNYFGSSFFGTTQKAIQYFSPKLSNVNFLAHTAFRMINKGQSSNGNIRRNCIWFILGFGSPSRYCATKPFGSRSLALYRVDLSQEIMNSHFRASTLVNLGKKSCFQPKYGVQFAPFGIHLTRDFSINPSEMSNEIVPTNTSALMEIKVDNIVSTNLFIRTDLAKSYFDVFAPTPYHDHHLIIGPKGVGKTTLAL